MAVEEVWRVARRRRMWDGCGERLSGTAGKIVSVQAGMMAGFARQAAADADTIAKLNRFTELKGIK